MTKLETLEKLAEIGNTIFIFLRRLEAVPDDGLSRRFEAQLQRLADEWETGVSDIVFTADPTVFRAVSSCLRTLTDPVPVIRVEEGSEIRPL